jgi:hypothetical protein
MACRWVHWSQHTKRNEVEHLHLQQLPGKADRWQLHDITYYIRDCCTARIEITRITNTQLNANRFSTYCNKY